jgi:hypothetical protein
MDNKAGCLICGEELVYSQAPKTMTCSFCGDTHQETVECSQGHFVCNRCHSAGANDLIQRFCENTRLTNPIEMAIQLMQHPALKMHGPEHHYLVPAVLLTSYYNVQGKPEIKIEKLLVARQRSEKIPGGFCGSHGNCGAGVGTGIFYSLITETTPLSGKSWQQSNLLTGTCLVAIAKKGGPRCCKRDTYTAINIAVDFIEENLNVTLPTTRNITCIFHTNNKQCLGTACAYFELGPILKNVLQTNKEIE